MSLPYYIRTATPQDAGLLLKIYAPYVERTAVTFEYEVPTIGEFADRISHTLERYPYIVAQSETSILGYAYGGPFKERAAYDWSVETSIYVDMDMRRQGIGKALYAALERALVLQGILNVNACIAYTANEDGFLTNDSIYFHEKQGYTQVAHFHKCGYKFKHWYDMVWMEKFIGNHLEDQPQVRPFGLTDNNTEAQ